MTISNPVSLPTSPSFKSLTLYAKGAVGKNKSPFTLKEQIYLYEGCHWGIRVEYPTLTVLQAKAITAFLLSLNFGERSFFAGDPNASTPSGVASGTPLVNGASQVGYSLATDGWNASVTNILKAGDYIQIGNNLFMNLTDVNSNGSGQATLDLFPSFGNNLRGSPSDNASIIVTNPKGLFRIDSDTVVWSTTEEKTYSVAFDAIENI